MGGAFDKRQIVALSRANVGLLFHAKLSEISARLAGRNNDVVLCEIDLDMVRVVEIGDLVLGPQEARGPVKVALERVGRARLPRDKVGNNSLVRSWVREWGKGKG